VLFSTQVFFSWVLFLYKGQAFHSFWTAWPLRCTHVGTAKQ
jgi:hypothetical protein